jgi:hypothetical protein
MRILLHLSISLLVFFFSSLPLLFLFLVEAFYLRQRECAGVNLIVLLSPSILFIHQLSMLLPSASSQYAFGPWSLPYITRAASHSRAR